MFHLLRGGYRAVLWFTSNLCNTPSSQLPVPLLSGPWPPRNVALPYETSQDTFDLKKAREILEPRLS